MELVFADGPSPGSWRGMAAMAKGFGDFVSAWEEYRVIVDDCRELDDERVLVFVHLNARGKTSGIELGQIQTSKGAVHTPCFSRHRRRPFGPESAASA